jgi:hypothetical protein
MKVGAFGWLISVWAGMRFGYKDLLGISMGIYIN